MDTINNYYLVNKGPPLGHILCQLDAINTLSTLLLQ
jgi:hypothetical protein